MARTSLRFGDATPNDVLAVLADGRRYAEWVVGAKRIRSVDASWPAPGSRFHHSLGVGPFTLDDSTVIVSSESIPPPPGATSGEVVLEARAWPAGTGLVTVTVRAAAEGSGSQVTIDEVPHHGLAKILDNPLLHALTALRNATSLRRLREAARTV